MIYQKNKVCKKERKWKKKKGKKKKEKREREGELGPRFLGECGDKDVRQDPLSIP